VRVQVTTQNMEEKEHGDFCQGTSGASVKSSSIGPRRSSCRRKPSVESQRGGEKVLCLNDLETESTAPGPQELNVYSPDGDGLRLKNRGSKSFRIQKRTGREINVPQPST